MVVEKTKFGMPLLGLGTYKLLGAEPVREAVDAALQCGYRFLDTAQVYENEAELGMALEELLPKHGLQRKDLFITTKLSSRNMHPGAVLPSLRQSLKDLRTSYVDAFLIHYPKPFGEDIANDDPRLPQLRREVWAEMESGVEEGLCHTIGVSNHQPRHLVEMEAYARIKPVLNQCEYHPHMTRKELVEECRRQGIHFQAFTSLARNHPQMMEEATLAEVAKAHSATPQQILLAFALCQGISVIPKSSRPDIIASNWAAHQIRLTQPQLERLSALNRDLPYTKCHPWNVL